MKRLGRILAGVFAVALTAVSLQVMAAEAQLGGRDFNHMTTGFSLSGGHAIAPCETCHIGGVFKGTPRNCDGCHAVGRRILATPKSTAHIVTNAPCETCHFNTSTFLGARFNHGSAIPGQCITCHNGRIAQGKTSSARHSSAFGQGACDTCHRTSTWMVAGWNHTNNATITYSGQSCNAQCHTPTGMANTKTWEGTPRHLPYPTFMSYSFASCQTCHLSYSSFSVVRYAHPSGLACGDCHNSTYNLGAVRGKPANHIPDNGAPCQNCHTGNYSWQGMNHSVVTPPMLCKTCHLSGTSYLGNMEKKGIGHEGMSSGDDCSQSGCHRPAGNRGTTYINWD